jgi:hypothetical protein
MDKNHARHYPNPEPRKKIVTVIVLYENAITFISLPIVKIYFFCKPRSKKESKKDAANLSS